MTKPNRDSSLDLVIPCHEYTHGISNRLTGGSHNGHCLQTTESGGLGEGWGDAVGIFLNRKKNHTHDDDVSVGWYVMGTKPDGPNSGVRKWPYSTNMTRNPHLFSDVQKQNEVHNIGEIWASILFEVYWSLVDKFGFSENWLDASQTEGNIVAMQVLIGGVTF